MSVIISAKNVVKKYGSKKEPIVALGPVSLDIEAKTFTVIIGRSGSGKSTFLNLMAGLDVVSEGVLEVDGLELSNASGGKLAKYRAGVGIIFQSYNLLPNLSALENVEMGVWASGKQANKQRAVELLNQFGLSHRLNANVKTLSGGEKQRVAICRSLINQPKILFCDEPTGALDSVNEKQVKEILLQLHSQGLTIVMVTHNPEFANYADKVVHMQDGKIESIKEVATKADISVTQNN
jgi:putative ABC transport system ATP-binding protein